MDDFEKKLRFLTKVYIICVVLAFLGLSTAIYYVTKEIKEVGLKHIIESIWEGEKNENSNAD